MFVNGQTDQDNRNRQASWYYFRVDAAEGKTLTIDILGLPGEYNYQPNRGAITKDTPPVISYDHKTWRHVTDFEYDEKEPRLRLRIHPLRRRFWIAHTPPYTLRDLASLRQVVLSHPDVREQKIGKSVQGHDLLLWTIGKRGCQGYGVADVPAARLGVGKLVDRRRRGASAAARYQAARRHPLENSPDGRSGRRGTWRSPLQP